MCSSSAEAAWPTPGCPGWDPVTCPVPPAPWWQTQWRQSCSPASPVKVGKSEPARNTKHTQKQNIQCKEAAAVIVILWDKKLLMVARGWGVRVWPCVWSPDQKLWTASRPLGPKTQQHNTCITHIYVHKQTRNKKRREPSMEGQRPVATFPRDRVELSASSTSWAISFLNCCTSRHSLARAWCRISSATRSPWQRQWQHPWGEWISSVLTYNDVAALVVR